MRLSGTSGHSFYTGCRGGRLAGGRIGPCRIAHTTVNIPLRKGGATVFAFRKNGPSMCGIRRNFNTRDASFCARKGRPAQKRSVKGDTNIHESLPALLPLFLPVRVRRLDLRGDICRHPERTVY